MKNIFTRNIKGKAIALAVTVVVYLGLQLLSMTVLSKFYLFEWMSRRIYCCTWIPAVVLIAFDKTLISYFVTFGNLAGTIIGQLLGDIIEAHQKSLITPDMDNSEIYLMTMHQGVFIWSIIFTASIAVGIVLNIIFGKRKKRLTAQNHI